MNEEQLKVCHFFTQCRYLGVREDNSYECLKKTHKSKIDKEVYAVVKSLAENPNATLAKMLPLGDNCEGI